MRVVAFIFARGGSKGLPGKNIRLLNGTPLIGYSIQLAKRLEAVERVFVSTDADDIAKVAIEYGAEVIRRPAELASDTASEWHAWQHAVNYLAAQGVSFDVFLSLPATSPLREQEDVLNCLNALSDETDAVVTVTEAARSPYFNMVTRDSDGQSKLVISDTDVRRRQDSPPVYDMTTVAYVTRPSYIAEASGVFDGKVKSVVVPKERAIDIDDAHDFMVAEAMLLGVKQGLLASRNILVAGAGGLLGSHLVKAVLDNGASVVAVDINVDQMRHRLGDLGIEESSSHVRMIQMDITDEDSVKSCFASFKNLTGAVNCTYPRNPQYGASFFDVQLSDFNENVSLHLGSSFFFMQQCAAYFYREGAPFSLVNISSIYGVVPPRFEIYKDTSMTTPVEYAAIKSALIHLTKYLVSYVSNSDFRANCVSPGGILDGQPSTFLSEYKKHTCGKGMLDTDDILGAIVFLLSDLSQCVNGQNVVVDDGFTL